MRKRREPSVYRAGVCPAFTLVELLVVMVIIGIIITFLLVAGGEARRRAEEDATLALITKLEAGVNDRLDALLQTRPDPNPAHYYMAGVYIGNADGNGNQEPLGWPKSQYGSAAARAQVIAWYDYVKSEMPDVFFVQNFNPTAYSYPLNFAFPAAGYPGATIDQQGLGNFILPLGNSVAGPLIPPSGFTPGYGAGNYSNTVGTGIFGASYFAAASLYKNLGYVPTGYDGLDNDGNGLVDEWQEGVNAGNHSQVLSNLAAHKHNTARAETLYAILVEGVGPLGAFFNRDDFSDKEVRDTDGDGLPEFVDAWGQPIQFFRWPLLYHTDTQRGQVVDYWDYTQTPAVSSPIELFNPPYRTVFEAREQDPFDPNQLLVAPAWWAAAQNTQYPLAFTGTAGSLGGSGGVVGFEAFFHRLTEPVSHNGNYAYYWDRGTIFPNRRAFFSKPLILSSGFDQQLGVFLLYPSSVFPSPPALNAYDLITYENYAIPFDPGQLTNSLQIPVSTQVDPTSQQLREYGRDDISNQNRQASGGSGGS